MAFLLQGSSPAGIRSMAGQGANLAAIGLFAALLAVAAIYFRDGFEALFIAWQTPEYSHGPLIPFLSGFLFLRHLKKLPMEAEADPVRWPGVFVILLSIAFGAVGKLAQIPDIVAYSMIVFVAGLVLLCMGWNRGWRCWPEIVHLSFMLPLPATLYWKVSTTLQLISSEFGVFLIQLAGIPVYLDGNIIDLGVYKLHVAEACSGLRYLYPILSFSYIFAVLYRGPVWHKVVLLLSAAPITMAMNSVRIGIIGIIVDRYGLEHVEGITHLLEGWIIFVVSVVILFGMARVMLMMQRSRMGLAEALDLEFDNIVPQFARIRSLRMSSGLVMAFAAMLVTTIGWELAPQREVTSFDRAPLALLPLEIGTWRSEQLQTLEPEIERVLGADDYYAGVFASPSSAATVDFFIAWYQDQTQGGIHSPEVCLPGGGWEMAEIRRIDLGEGRPVNRAIIQKGEQRLLVYYWFQQAGGRTASDYVAKAAVLRDSVLHGRSDGALVRAITPILNNESERDAERRLRSFVDPLEDVLPRFVPQM
jgi:exosortase D (VPLPA-CTERM-specific)